MICIDQHTPIQEQMRSLREKSALQNPVMPWQKPQCAWCLSEQGRELGSGSHGICVQHAAVLLEQRRAQHAGRYHQYQSALV